MVNEAIIALSKIINVPQDRIVPYKAQVEDSITSQLEAESGTIFMYQDIATDERYVVKIKSEYYYIGLEQIVNPERSESFKQQFYEGCDIFMTKCTHIRETMLYSYNDAFLQAHIPPYLGSIEIANNTYIAMQYIDFSSKDSLNQKTEIAMRFLATLHSRFFQQYDTLNSMQLNTLSPKMFADNKYLLETVYKTAVEQFELPKQLTIEIGNYIGRIEEEVLAMQKHGLTLCHCDFAFRNIATNSGNPTVIDWEMAMALEPQFDLIEFLVDYPTRLDSHIINDVIEKYVNNSGCCSTDGFDNHSDFYTVMLRNLYQYFVVRQAGIILINRVFPIPWINGCIQNYISLWEHIVSSLNQKKRQNTN